MLIVQENRDLPGINFIRVLGKPTDEELKVYIASETARFERDRHQRMVIVFELKEVWTSTQRKMMRDWELEHVAKASHNALGMAMVVPNSVIRGAFTAYFWIAPPSYPTKMVATAHDAFDWVTERLQEAGMPTPSRDAYVRSATARWAATQAVPGKGMVSISEADLAGKLSA